MKKLIISLYLLLGGLSGYASDSKTYVIKNEPCESCVLIAVVGHGVAKGHEGRYYFPLGYTVERFWREKPVPLDKYAHHKIMLTRIEDNGEKINYVIDTRKIKAKPERAEFILQAGDVMSFTQPFL